MLTLKDQKLFRAIITHVGWRLGAKASITYISLFRVIGQLEAGWELDTFISRFANPTALDPRISQPRPLSRNPFAWPTQAPNLGLQLFPVSRNPSCSYAILRIVFSFRKMGTDSSFQPRHWPPEFKWLDDSRVKLFIKYQPNTNPSANQQSILDI